MVDNAAKHVAPLDLPRAQTAGQRDWTVLLETLMRTPLVVEVDLGRQHPEQVALVQDEQPV